jgi:hypothetical protein
MHAVVVHRIDEGVPQGYDRHRLSTRSPTGASLLRMCRNIHTLHNFEPAATSDEVRAAALQYVRKVSGSTHPSQANRAAFDEAVEVIAHATQHLLDHLVTNAAPKNREIEAEKARERAAKRYASMSA